MYDVGVAAVSYAPFVAELGGKKEETSKEGDERECQN